jgi:hypothetical protein
MEKETEKKAKSTEAKMDKQSDAVQERGEITGLLIEDIKKMNLWEKMAIATSSIERVNKNLKIDISSTRSYKAVSEGAVLEAVKKVEAELRIYSFPMAREITDRDVLETEKEFKGNITRSNQLFMRVQTRYFFVNIDNPQEQLQVMSYGDGLDSGDKASGKAMTYADKYALMKAYKIETGDDPDQEASPELKGSKNKSASQKAESEAISENQISMLKRWATDEARTKNMIAELVVSTGRKIEKFEDLTKAEASKFINAVIEASKKRKAQQEAEAMQDAEEEILRSQNEHKVQGGNQ